MKIIDMHCDTISEIWEARKRGEGCSIRKNAMMIDLKRLRENHYLVQNYALFVDGSKAEHGCFAAVKELIQVFKQEMKANADWIGEVHNVEEILENERQGKVSALLTVEEGGVCEGSLEHLYYLYDQGVRMMTITWNYPNELGYPNYNENGDMYVPDIQHGLTEHGIVFVEEMERLGMIVDVSHLSDAGFYDVLTHTKKPFVASHSNARGVCRAARNLSDDMIRRLGERGGVAGLNFSVDFLREHEGCEGVDARNPANWGRGYASIADIVKHAKYIANVGGMECVGLGSDFDGISPHPELVGAEDMPKLIEEFRKAGFHESEIDKICYGNVLRVYSEVLK
ncbi:MAG: dipeptidase [Clostridiales bacterium]|nr:dipeptidase [Clostridiales bacterium]